METHLLAIQARLLLLTGLGWLGFGLWQGQDPVTVAWRAALGAVICMWIAGKLLRMVAQVIEERVASDFAEAQVKLDAAAAAAATPAQTLQAAMAKKQAGR